MQETRDLAVVLRSVPYEERHRIVTALTENHGLVSALARNAVQSRRFGGTLEPFAASEWHFFQKPNTELVRLEQAHIRRAFAGLRTDFERLALASLLSEIVLRVAPHIESSGDLFRVHSNALAWLEESQPGENELALLNGYISKVLQWSGNQPQFSVCSGCQSPIESLPVNGSVLGVVADAGWICPSCRSQGAGHARDRHQHPPGQRFENTQLRVSTAAIRDFHMSLGVPIRQIPAAAQATRAQHVELFKFLEALLVFHLPGFDQAAMKSLRFLSL
jgi:DNA repair protein RecO